MDYSPFPVRVEADDDESGMGFLLRVASRNGVPLQALLRLAGTTKSRWTKPSSIPTLAHVAGVSSEWLRHRLVVERSDRGSRFSEWRGALWSFPLCFRGMKTQYCDACLRERCRCLAGWELSGAFACLQHRRLLKDRCPHCGRPVPWTRPTIDVCACGRYLTIEAAGDDANAWQLAWTSSILARTTDIAAAHDQRIELPPCLRQLSPDGLLAIVYSFGIRENEDSRVSGADTVLAPSPSQVAVIVQRGLGRLQDIRPFEDACSRRLRGVVHVEGLERLGRRSASSSDRAAAIALRDWVTGVPRSGYSVVGRRIRGQLDLFR
jgi:hypothetical protein